MLNLLLGGVLASGVATLIAWMAKGKLTLDAGIGRSFHELGPVALRIEAPRDLVYQHLAAPYLGRTPRGAAGSLQVLDKGTDLVVARHRSKVAFYNAETVESVRFDPPAGIHFRHLRGPVPHAVEKFELNELGDATELTYTGELGIDFWAFGSLAGRYWVSPSWMRIVEAHLGEVKAAVEKRAAARSRRLQREVVERDPSGQGP